jgi:hypothetical protein
MRVSLTIDSPAHAEHLHAMPRTILGLATLFALKHLHNVEATAGVAIGCT